MNCELHYYASGTACRICGLPYMPEDGPRECSGVVLQAQSSESDIGISDTSCCQPPPVANNEQQTNSAMPDSADPGL